MVEKLLQLLVFILSGTFAAMIIIIGLCVFLIVFSMAVDCVTGFDLIREVIRPFFENLRK